MNKTFERAFLEMLVVKDAARSSFKLEASKDDSDEGMSVKFTSSSTRAAAAYNLILVVTQLIKNMINDGPSKDAYIKMFAVWFEDALKDDDIAECNDGSFVKEDPRTSKMFDELMSSMFGPTKGH